MKSCRDGAQRAAPLPFSANFYCDRIFSKKARARGSLDWPSQNMACLRTAGLRLDWATSMSLGTPSSLGIWLRAKTAFFFTSVSGSFSMALELAEAAFLLALWAIQKRAL